MKSKYYQIYDEIATDIKDNKIKANSKLKSENQMMNDYGVSRDTVRKALNLLAQNGYIQKVKGKGSFVLDVNKFEFPVSGLISFKELSEKMNYEVETILNEFELINPDDYLMQQLDIDENKKVWKVVRSRKIGKERIILDKEFFNSEYIEELSEEICTKSIYEYIEGVLKLNISFAKKEFTVEKATEEDRKYLDLGEYDMVVQVKNHVYLDDTTLFQYSESRHRPDKFTFVDFARRKIT